MGSVEMPFFGGGGGSGPGEHVFIARQSTTTNLNAFTLANMLPNHIDVDTDHGWNAATGVYTVATKGYWLIMARNICGAGNSINLFLELNIASAGFSTVQRAVDIARDSGVFGTNDWTIVSWLVHLNIGDQWQVTAECGNSNTTIGGDASQCSINAILLAVP